MARYKHIDTSPRLLVVRPHRQEMGRAKAGYLLGRRLSNDYAIISRARRSVKEGQHNATRITV